MKKLSIILLFALAAITACTKSNEVHPEIGDGNDENITVGIKNVHVEYTRSDISELSKVVFHYGPADANGQAQQFAATEMTKKETFFELALNDLRSDTLYWYYYELFPNNGDAFNTVQKTFHTQAYDAPEPPTPIEYVDLGLPSGTLWATCNVGANSPEEYGDYFAWGETQPKDYYEWNTYQYCNGTGDQLTKYCNDANFGYNGFTDNLTELLPEDDAARANWGDGWRMPTKEEWQELYNNTTNTWTTQNGVNGWLFTASNGNTTFLPAAGNWVSDAIFNPDFIGCYWSSSLYTNLPENAWFFFFYSNDYIMGNGDSRYCGRSVRPVRSSN